DVQARNRLLRATHRRHANSDAPNMLADKTISSRRASGACHATANTSPRIVGRRGCTPLVKPPKGEPLQRQVSLIPLEKGRPQPRTGFGLTGDRPDHHVHPSTWVRAGPFRLALMPRMIANIEHGPHDRLSIGFERSIVKATAQIWSFLWFAWALIWTGEPADV